MEVVLLLSLFILVPAGLLALVRPMGRRVLGVLGVLATIVLAYVPLGGPDSPALVWGILPLSVTVGAVVVELVALVLAAFRRRSRSPPAPSV